MDLAMQIVNAIIKIQENIFPDEWEDMFEDVNLSEVHCIDLIGTLEYPNVTKMANEMDMTRGAISKICKRLLKKGLVESYRRPDNNKEIYYRLTEEGQHIYNEHKKLHSKARQDKLSVINNYSEHEQAIILRFLNDINRLYHKKPAEEKTVTF
ncbi:MAG: MarR family transcriptional regulator [Thermoanaerobacterales bacterium]|jgi:DNA-binding MarR family transcriptional regulator|nr:MarR family transcriptional regulator [Thermoanaerobacterales bacterium]